MRALLPTLLLAALPAAADEANILAAEARPSGDSYTVWVTLSHADSGWEDYADAWAVELADGTVLATRVLLHPHVEEQPFTRALAGVAIPPGVARVFIRTRTTVEGWSEAKFALDLRRAE